MNPAPPPWLPVELGDGKHKSVARLALDVGEACAALGVGWDFWQEHVAPEVRIVRRGRRKLVAVAELTRWLEDNAELALEDRP